MCGIGASHMVRCWAPVLNDSQMKIYFKKKLEPKCLVKTSPVDKKCFLTCYISMHHASPDPILTFEKRDEMTPCISYGDIFRGYEDSVC